MQEFMINDTPVKMWARTCDAHAWKEVTNICSLPFIYHHVALMPDLHGGKGMPIGTVLATNGVVIPNAVGVDIGCGMCAVKTNIKVETVTQEVLRKKIMRGIRKQIPLGKEHHKQAQDEKYMPLGFDIDKLEIVKRRYVSATKQVGTLGGGNHFIELQKDDDGFMWIMIHSGSRNLGKQVGDYYNEKADMLNRRWFSTVKSEIMLPFIPLRDPLFKEYWNEMEYCIAFGLCNRRLMMQRIEEVIADAIPDAEFEPMINIAHNYAAWENHFGENCIVHRTGATRARLGEIGIIPGSQGTSSYIVEGLGNPDSFMSCSHGAGRAMSRTEAVHTLDLEKEKERLDSLGIVHAIRCQKDLEEAASAYKNIEEVIVEEQDLVKVKVHLSPIAVIKG